MNTTPKLKNSSTGKYDLDWAGTNEAGHVRQVASDVSVPAQWYITWDGALGTGDNTIVYQNNDVASYNYHLIENTSSGVLDVFISYDGSTYNATPVSVQLLDDVTAGGGVLSADIPAGKIGVVLGRFKGILIQQKGTTAANGRGSHSVN